jgi:dimethylargininase
MFTRAIVRAPAPNFAEGLTTATLGPPEFERALRQHESYCAALEQCGLTLTRLDPDLDYPDSTFVEDVAILTERCAILTRPGAPSRRGEGESVRKVLAEFFPSLHEIESPGTVDGGDICQAGDHFFVGLSARTNEEGARQLAAILTKHGSTSSFVDIRTLTHAQDGRAISLLHLKSALAYLGNKTLVITEALAKYEEFRGYRLIHVNPSEEYAANCVMINDCVLIAAGHRKLETELHMLGYETIALEMSEFQKMDGGLSCLSLRF